MKKSYCTQNNGDCLTCSLVNYGLDCANNSIESMAPIPQLLSRKGTKNDRAMAIYDGFKGGATVAHIQKLIGKELADRLTGHELGLVMSAVNRAYQEGKASTGAEVIDDSYVWVNCIDEGFDVGVLRRLKKTETRVKRKVYYDGGIDMVINYRYQTHDDMPYKDQCTSRDLSYIPSEEWSKWYRYEYDNIVTWELMQE